MYFGLTTLNGRTFTSGSFVVTGEGLQIVSVPFTFTGIVSAFDHPNVSVDDEPIFTAMLAGSGLARAAFAYQPGEGGRPAIYSVTTLPGGDYQLEYRFSTTAAPIPEPGTLALLASGGLALGLRLMRRRPAASRVSRQDDPAGTTYDTGRTDGP